MAFYKFSVTETVVVTLRFYDNESIEAQILGSLMVDGERYAAFLGEDKSVYLYKCKKKGNDYAALLPKRATLGFGLRI